MDDAVQSRFTVYERPDASPGKCIVCGATQRPVVDFGVDIEWADMGYGKALFCEFCIKEAASKFPSSEPVHETHEDWVKKFEAWKGDFVGEVLTTVEHYRPSADLPIYGSIDSVPEQTEPSDTQDTEQHVQRFEPAVNRFVIETDEPTVDEDSSGVSSSTGNGKSSIFG